MKKTVAFVFVVVSLVVCLAFEMSLNGAAQSQKVPATGFDEVITNHSKQMMESGRQTFRHDTFGSEAFWGDALQLHKAIAGEKNGGVGGGVSPKTALSVGLKVDADALPASLVEQLNAVVGVTGLFDKQGNIRSMAFNALFAIRLWMIPSLPELESASTAGPIAISM
jgi:hypothetical protein